MSTRRVLIVESHTTAGAIRSALARRGFEVRTAGTVDEALCAERPDVLVTETELPDGTGAELVTALRARGVSPRVVFVSSQPTVHACREALLLGASDFLTKPFRLEELVHAVEEAPAAAQATATANGTSTAGSARTGAVTPVTVGAPFDRGYSTSDDDIERATRELASYLVGLGAGPSCRTRIVSATGELFDNVRRHAYCDRAEGEGTFRLRVDADPHFFTVTVEDEGAGFEPGEVTEYAFDCPTHNGFARAACLAEDVQLQSYPGRGASVALRFTSYRVEFDEEDHIDLTELDYLTPELARRVLETLNEEDNDDPFRLSPAMAVVVGRLLAGPDPTKRLHLALWS